MEEAGSNALLLGVSPRSRFLTASVSPRQRDNAT
jgi:hypothetical protein